MEKRKEESTKEVEWFERKVAELRIEVEKLPRNRQARLEQQLESEEHGDTA